MTESKKTKEQHDGIYEWVDSGHGSGFWMKQEDEQMIHDRIPTSCRACNSWLYNWDRSYHLRYGVCADCYITYMEGRENLPAFKNNDERAEYVKQKIAEKKLRT